MFEELAARMDVFLLATGLIARLNPLLRWLERRCPRLTPWKVVNALLRMGPYGDRFGRVAAD